MRLSRASLSSGIRMIAIDPFASITDLSVRIRDRSLSPVSVVDACLARIEALNPHLNAFITITGETAREAARVAESEITGGRWRGPLHGIPVGVKDFFDTAGVKTTAAFEQFANRVPAEDADVVKRLKNAGAIVIGKTNMDTLGMATTGLQSFYGPVRNPWNADYIAGGSSSGSAAAVASGMCFATVDTDAVGSCRLPAACCGVVGFKGTYGLISTEGILAGQPPPDEMIVWFSHPGVTTRRVSDAALVVDVLKQPEVLSRSMELAHEINEPTRFCIGVAANVRADSAASAAFKAAVETVAGLGHEMRTVEIAFADPSSGIRNIERDRKAVSREMFGDVDIVLLPTTTTRVPRASAASHPQALSPENTVFANYYGLPAINVPAGFDSNGMPVGLQLAARPSRDLDILILGQQYERTAGWIKTHPVLENIPAVWKAPRFV
jgi:aspartyl-tRNA(Asn)/glutamyl-tRNA(Gln) amidotransferase subunit A